MENEIVKLVLAAIPGLFALLMAIVGYATMREKVFRLEIDTKDQKDAYRELTKLILDIRDRLARIETKVNNNGSSR